MKVHAFKCSFRDVMKIKKPSNTNKQIKLLEYYISQKFQFYIFNIYEQCAILFYFCFKQISELVISENLKCINYIFYFYCYFFLLFFFC